MARHDMTYLVVSCRVESKRDVWHVELVPIWPPKKRRRSLVL